MNKPQKTPDSWFSQQIGDFHKQIRDFHDKNASVR
jgi:hypothetical protein